MGTLSRIALFLFLVVGLIASAERPGTINDPFASARATPLPTRVMATPVALTPEEQAKFRDERRNYYQYSDGGTNWDGNAVIRTGGAADTYDQCRAKCSYDTTQTVECNTRCDRAYMNSAATNKSQIYQSVQGQPLNNNGTIRTDGLRMPASLGTPRETSKTYESGSGPSGRWPAPRSND